MLNNCCFNGRLAGDPVKRTLNNNQTLTTFTLAVTRNRPNSKGEWVADFIDFNAWNALGNKVLKYKKGAILAVNGRLEVIPFTDKSGAKRSRVVITAEFVQELPSAYKKQNKPDDTSSPTSSSASEDEFREIDESDVELEDLPF